MRKIRKAFSMLIAIFIIVLLSLIATYVYYSSSLITKEGTIMYQEEQAKILARSFTEYAVLAVSSNNRTMAPCLDKISSTIGNPDSGQGYKVEVYITYIGNLRYVGTCQHTAAILPNTDGDSLSVILDVYVKYKDIQNASLYNGYQNSVPWQTYHRRSIQKI